MLILETKTAGTASCYSPASECIQTETQLGVEKAWQGRSTKSDDMKVLTDHIDKCYLPVLLSPYPW